VPGSVSANELEGMLFYAINDALEKVKQQATQHMASVTSGEKSLGKHGLF
jgi:DNA-binding protein YbaB